MKYMIKIIREHQIVSADYCYCYIQPIAMAALAANAPPKAANSAVNGLTPSPSTAPLSAPPRGEEKLPKQLNN